MSTTVIVRRIAATPARSTAEAWTIIADLIAPPVTAARQELDRAAGIAMTLIADEAMRDSPVVVRGVGPRLRVYCLYDDEAVLGEGASEDALAWCPTDGDWALSLPCAPEDLSWVPGALARVSKRITARDRAESGPPEQAQTAQADLSPIDLEAFRRP